MKPKAKVGRPTKFTPAVRASILADLAAGLFIGTAANRAGVSRGQVHAWRQEDQEFSDACARARAEGEAQLVAALLAEDMSGKVEGANLRWYLERLNTKHYHLPTKTEVTGAKGGPLAVEVTAAKLAALLEPK